MSATQTDIKVAQLLQPLAAGLEDIIKEQVGKKTCFALMVFTDGRTQYVSNANRDDITVALENLLGRWKVNKQEVQSPLAEIMVDPVEKIDTPVGPLLWFDVREKIKLADDFQTLLDNYTKGTTSLQELEDQVLLLRSKK